MPERRYVWSGLIRLVQQLANQVGTSAQLSTARAPTSTENHVGRKGICECPLTSRVTHSLSSRSTPKLGGDNSVDCPLRCTFPSICSEFLRRLRRRNRANSARPMQPPSRKVVKGRSLKGRFDTLAILLHR